MLIIVPLPAKAVSFGETPFGGRITFAIFCTCNTNPTDKWIIVSAPRGGSFMKVTRTKVYDHHNVSTGKWVLGMASNDKEKCNFGVASYCYTIGEGKKIKYLGTS